MDESADTFFARQPIFDASEGLFGYELLYRHSGDAEVASFAKEDKATFDVIVNYYNHINQMGAFTGKIIINFTPRSILDDSHYALMPENAVLKIVETAPFEPLVVDALTRVKSEGYQLAVGIDPKGPKTPGLLALADILIIDVLPGQAKPALSRAEFSGRYLAKRVEDLNLFAMAKENGFSLFQGFYFEKPQIIPGRRLSSSEIARFNLLKTIEEEDPDFTKLAAAIQADVSITYRLLSYLNSAAFGQQNKVDSIRHALVLLGWKHLRNWLRLLILTDVLPAKKTKELLHTALIRGLFLESCAKSVAGGAKDADNLYLLGLFSLLDTMLGMPMNEIAGRLPLEDSVKAALVGQESPLSPWLTLVIAFEAADWAAVGQSISALGLDQIGTAKHYYDALLTASNFFGVLG